MNLQYLVPLSENANKTDLEDTDAIKQRTSLSNYEGKRYIHLYVYLC